MTCEFTNFKCLFQWTNRAFWVKQVVFSPGPQLDLGLLQVGSELLYFFSQIQSWDLGSDLDIWFPLAPDWSWCRSSAHIWPIDNSSLGNLNFKLGSASPTYCIRQGKGKFPPTHVLLWEQAFILSPKARLPLNFIGPAMTTDDKTFIRTNRRVQERRRKSSLFYIERSNIKCGGTQTLIHILIGSIRSLHNRVSLSWVNRSGQNLHP